MCESPIYIKNLNHYTDSSLRQKMAAKQPWKDFDSAMIAVPCGHCRECIRARQMAIVQRVQMESWKNHLFMCTLTYCNEMLPIKEVNGFKIRYADTSDVRNMYKRLRLNNAFGIPFRHLSVSELGSLRGRPHFHLLLMFPKSYFSPLKEDYILECESFASKSEHYFTILNEWKRNVSSSKKFPEWKPLTHYVEKFYHGQLRKNYDFHYINPFLTKNGVEDCGMYVLKYMFKPSDRAVKLQQALRMNLSEDEYKDVWNQVRPRYFASIGFGYNADVQLKQKKFDRDPDIVSKIRKDVETSKIALEYPAYFHPFTGRQELISPYYLDNLNIYSKEDRIYFWNLRNVDPGAAHDIDPITNTEYVESTKHFTRTIQHCDDLGLDSDFELLDT